MDERLADALLAAGIIDAEQAERLRAELRRLHAEDYPSLAVSDDESPPLASGD